MNNNINVDVITGGNNNFNQHNHFNQPPNNKGGGNKPEEEQATAGAALLSLFVATVAAAVAYLNHYEAVFFWLRLGIIAGGLLHLLPLAAQLHDPFYRYRDSLPTIGGIALTAALAWVFVATSTALPTEVFAAAARLAAGTGHLQQMLEVWQRFNSTGQHLILQNVGAALLLAMAVLCNIAFAAQHAIESCARVWHSPALSAVSHWLRPFRTYAAFAATATAFGAFIVILGFVMP